MQCPKCGSFKVSEVPNNTLDVVAKCDKCGYEDFVKKFDESAETCIHFDCCGICTSNNDLLKDASCSYLSEPQNCIEYQFKTPE